MFDSIIFDVDGTLWDSRKQVVRAWSEAKRELVGYPLSQTFEEMSGWFGSPMPEIAMLMFPEFDRDTAIAYGNQCFQKEITYLKKNPGELFPGVKQMLAKLSETYPLYIVSNCQLGYIDVLLESGNLTDFISGHLCYEDTMQPKDKTIRILMKKYNLKNTIYIGDTVGDWESCQKADIPFLFAEYGFGSLSETCPRVKSIAEIPHAVETYVSSKL